MSRLLDQKIWNQQKLLMLIQFIVTPVIAVGIVAWKGLDNYTGSQLFTISQNLLGIFICGLLFISSVKDRENRTLRTACFAYLVNLTSIQMFLNTVSYSLPRGGIFNHIEIFVETLFELNSTLTLICFMTYLIECANVDNDRMKRFQRIFNIGSLLNALIIAGNVFGHYFFYIDESDVFVMTRYYNFYAVYPLVVNIIIFLFIIRMKTSVSDKYVLTTFVSLPVASIVFYIITDISFVYSALMCSLIFIFGNLSASQEIALAKSQMDVIQKENALLRAKKEHSRVEAELNLASGIQTHILPMSFPPFPDKKEFDLYASMIPAKEVGGDFYDFFLIDEDHVGLVMADVSGKGVPAALYMMVAKTMIKNMANQKMPPAKVLELVNHQLCEGDREIEMFVTVWYGIYEISTGKLTAANAGHEYPVIRHADGQFELFKDKHGFVLGGMDGCRYKDYEIQMAPGSILFLYTDGIPEATNDDNELLGTARMIESLNNAPSEDIKDLIHFMNREVEQFTGEADQFDDVTMLALRINSVSSETTKGKEFKPSIESLPLVQQYIESTLEQAGVPMNISMKVDVVVDELYSNIAMYSNATTSYVNCLVENNQITLRFEDDGISYDPTRKKDPDITLSAEERDIGGLGIYITKKLMDSMDYTREFGKNIIVLTKSI